MYHLPPRILLPLERLERSHFVPPRHLLNGRRAGLSVPCMPRRLVLPKYNLHGGVQRRQLLSGAIGNSSAVPARQLLRAEECIVAHYVPGRLRVWVVRPDQPHLVPSGQLLPNSRRTGCHQVQDV